MSLSNERLLVADKALRERAQRVVPGGMYGHMNAGMLPPDYPQFFHSGKGCRLRDVDGNEYIDFMCSWGPIVLGHGHPEIEAAVARQFGEGDCLNGPSERMVELAEALVALIPHADWAIFAKNGTDATTQCVMIARAATERRKVLVAEGAYHGAAPWCTRSLAGVTAEDRAHLRHYRFNDIASVRAAVAQAEGDVAAILVSAFRHDFGQDQELPTPEFALGLRAICDDQKAALIIDDVRAGFRLDLGGSWETLGVRPDLSAWSKAIANGYPLAAVTGNDRYRDAATRIFTTGSFWMGAASMAAALATIRILKRDKAVEQMRRMGERLRDGLARQARAYGIGIRQSGPPQMPLVLFDDDADFSKGFAFTNEAVRRGVYLHPKHNMFLCAAHTERDIDAALAATDEAFATVKRRWGGNGRVRP
jgi:glutamate-1-semialdehyde 2,1-aminomutase